MRIIKFERFNGQKETNKDAAFSRTDGVFLSTESTFSECQLLENGADRLNGGKEDEHG